MLVHQGGPIGLRPSSLLRVFKIKIQIKTRTLNVNLVPPSELDVLQEKSVDRVNFRCVDQGTRRRQCRVLPSKKQHELTIIELKDYFSHLSLTMPWRRRRLTMRDDKVGHMDLPESSCKFYISEFFCANLQDTLPLFVSWVNHIWTHYNLFL